MKLTHLLIFAVVILSGSFSRAENPTSLEELEEQEDSSETKSVPAFVRSKFNLRIWSTTEASKNAENKTESSTTLETASSTPASTTTTSIRPKRTRTTTKATATITTSPTTELSTKEGDTTSEPPATEVFTESTTTAKPKQKKQQQAPGCGEMNGDDVPWIAILEHTDPKGGNRKKTLSKGVLIDDRHVLTTISSIHNSYPFWIVTSIRLGDSPTWASTPGGKETALRKKNVVSIPVKNVFLHERKDIAVIRLAERVNITTPTIRPICLPMSDRFNYTELHFHICRKEKADFGRMSSRSKLVAVTTLTQKDCQILFRRHNADVGLKEFCAWDETGDNCTGDLGGPLMVKLNGRYHVVGLNSYALAKAKIDSEGLPGVYVRVGSYLKWIQAVLKTEFEDSL
ncbi:CLIP domain-containing serine protease B4-like [Uranotaenia lowii]|uniref:CLIP domain-containing serine protease B4-like n=1 Tax=Uranotaenia lowii TaxID=190385 RepID=UPI002479EFC4|nr:CLIP domain-containing serine protease B4-like [Uranotaenia lowii]